MPKYTSPTTPMKHQRQYLQRVARRPRSPSPLDVFSVNGEMGTGKSKMVLDEWQAGVGAGTYTGLLVVAPAGSYTNWFLAKGDAQPSELDAHLDPKLRKQLQVGAWASGGSAAMRRQLQRVVEDTSGKPRAVFMNIEAFSVVELAEKLAAQYLRSGKILFVVDESTKIKSKKAERTKTIVRRLAPLAAGRRIMSGLMTPKSPLDLFWQFYFLDWRILGFETPTGFRDRYAIVEHQCFQSQQVIRAKLLQCMGLANDGSPRLPLERLRTKLVAVRTHLQEPTKAVAAMDHATVARKLHEHALTVQREDMLALIEKLGGYIQMVAKVKEFQNLDELQAKVAPYNFRITKDQCMDLPPKVYEPRDVELTAEQRRLYKEIKANATAQLESGEHIVASTVIAQMLRLHQVVCGHVRDENKLLHNVKSNRVRDVLEVLEEHSDKAIIWSAYRVEVEKLVDALRTEYGSASVAQYHGGNKGTRAQDERNFLDKSGCRFMVSTQAAGGIGNTWNVANLTIYAANNYDLELRMQSEDRNHRRGQRASSVTYIDMIARGTVEEKIVRSLRTKLDLSRVITGDNWREWLV